MLRDNATFGGYTADNLEAEEAFYREQLGLETDLGPMGLKVMLSHGNHVFIYHKDNHEPAGFTILNFVVEDIDTAVSALKNSGVVFELYPEMAGWQNENGIAYGRKAGMGPDIAWFKDPAGNTLAVLQD